MHSIVVIAHTIRSLWNVGSIFRSCDVFAVEHLYLTGYTAAPPRHEISVTALQAETWIPWTKTDDPLTIIQQYRDRGYAIVALEKTDKSTSIFETPIDGNLCLILGHEVLGVSSELLSHADHTVHIPMYGKKESLNVAVATGIALCALREGIHR